MPDDRHPADQAVTVPKKQRKSICILEEAFVGRISDGQQPGRGCGRFAGSSAASVETGS